MACVSPALFMGLPHETNLNLVGSMQSSMMKKNPFRVVRELGAGLQGRVVLAVDERENKYVAIKLPTAFDDQPQEMVDYRTLDYQVQSILQERQAHRLVSHENVIQSLRVVPGKKFNRAYVAMVTEYASNGDLFDIIADSGALPQPVCKFYFHQLIRGVQACHRAGVIHRDIKPENILFDEQFTLKICDFGLAVASRGERNVDDVMLRDVSGTALYMAPEIAITRAFRGTPLDVWSCGVVLFIMLTSFPPFQNAKEGDYWYDCIMSGRMDIFWSSQPEDMIKPNYHAMDLINRMLCPDPEKRITVAEILAHPWLGDVHRINRSRVVQEMKTRREHVLGNSFEI
ncbi:hypothetical protein Poli38472_013076 [Pythium oligandrum]|uniref:non-specific serine/threonine protein kinase n=1 Tax=Pythium oligandrum TaxID=41045 RepID=A0A8K1FKQ9_PYTOL|nr:hypothetical protein Poli38472_013076 [Pythium oligandrum]|eukprot:TMW64454.1 hypothetical protein Poli38472_013076 [Pythium oligandrum]